MPYQTKVVHSIYELSPDGLLKIPTRLTYGYDDTLFYDSYNTYEEAIQAIQDLPENHSEFLVLTRVITQFVV